jgi:preprotein translocase subunit Sec61beta
MRENKSGRKTGFASLITAGLIKFSIQNGKKAKTILAM